jgi:eukaryotic-like serine/threonine-protein kinase
LKAWHWPEQVLKKLSKYELLGELGHGAMGVVYRARDPIINRLVALKTITTGVADDPALLQRFYREAQSAGGLQHPNIVTIYDMGEAGELPYIAMELVEGENLEQVIARRSTLPLTLKLVYLMQACRAFDYAHKRGIVHRDIKPGNVMLSKEGVVKVVDFGIARVLENSRTQTGMLIGTFAYMSPEQYHGEHADERSDIWSFGILVYELLCYQKPFTGPTPASLMHSICNLEPAPLNQVLPECPGDLAVVVGKMLRKSPGERYQSMEDVLLDLDPICKTLQAQSVVDLLEQTRQLFEQGNFAEGRELVRQALQLESGNHQARTLLEKANVELRRISNRPKVQGLVEKGHALLGEGKLQEAKVAAESALHLDSDFAPAEELRQAIQKETDRIRLVAQCLEGARQKLAEGLPDEADGLLSKVFEADPASAQAQSLQEQVVREKAEREKARRLQEGLRRGRELWTLQNYDECLKVLEELEKEFSKHEEISRLRETVLEDQTEQQKQQALLRSRNLFAAGHHDNAIDLLFSLQKRFPSDEEIPSLLKDVRKDQINQLRLAGLADARSLLAGGQFDSCIALLAALEETFPEEQEITRLQEAAHQNKAEQIRQRGLVESRSLLNAGQYDACISLLTSLKQSFPDDQEILRLLGTANENKREQVRQRGVTEASKLLAARRYEECADFLSNLERQCPGDKEIQALHKTVREEQSEQQKQQDVEKARDLLAARRYDECLSLLASLQKRFPADPDIPKLQDAVKEDQARQRRLQSLEQARELLASKNYEKTAEELGFLLREFPEDNEAQRLLEFTRKEQAEQSRQEGLAKGQELIAARRYEEAITLSTRLQADFAGDTAVVRLLESARKEQAKHRQGEGVAEARKLLADRRYGESIALLSKLQADFPDEPEIARLLDTARGDLAEEGKQQKLTEARSLLAAQSFGEALAILDGLAAEHPNDSTVSKLRTLLQRERDKHVKAQRLERELDALKRLMGEKKYPLVMTRARQLLTEFPADANLVRLSEFASSQQAKIEKEAVFQQKFAETKNLFDVGRFDETMRVAKAALKTFPSNAELQNLYQQAEIQQKKLEVRQKIEQRIRQVRIKINREELSEAVALAQQTLTTLGPDTDLSQLLNSAQVEMQAREKKRQQEGALETIHTLIDSGDLDGASQSIEKVIESNTLDSSDPRIQRLSERLKDARAEAAREPPGTQKPGVPGLSKEYALATPIPQAPPAPGKPPTADFTSTGSYSPSTAAVPERPAPGKPSEPVHASTDPAVQVPSEAPAQQVEPETDAIPSTPAIKPEVEQEPAVIPPPPGKPPVVAPAPVQPHPDRRGISVAPWMKVAAGFIAFVLVAAVWLGMRSSNTNNPSMGPVVKTAPQRTVPRVDPLEVAQRQALDAANARIAANDLDGAIPQLQQGAQLNGPLTQQIQKTLAEVEESKNNAVVAAVRRREADLWQTADTDVKEGRYSQAEKLLTQILALGPEGVRKADARNYLEKVIPQRKKNDSLSLQAQMSLRQKEYAAAREYTDQLQQNGGDAGPLNVDIDRLESSELKQLENQFDQARQGDDTSAVSQLTALQPSFQKLLQDRQFSQAEEAQRYLDNVPGAINDVNHRVDAKAVAATAEAERGRREKAFQQTLQGYRQGPQDKAGLIAARDKFQTIVQNDPSHADKARQYLNEIENKLAELNKPVPPLVPPGRTPAEIAAADDKAIRGVVDKFFAAFQARDPNALKQVWPAIPQKKYDGYKGSFALFSQITIQSSSPNVQIAPDGSTASVTVQVQQQEIPKGDNKPRTHSDSWNFQLSKRNGSWGITNVR